MAISYNPRMVTDGLVLCLDAGNPKSYPGSGTTWTDLSGQGNNGTLLNGVGYNSGNGGALSFDGTNDYLELTDTNNDFDLGGTNATLECWVYPTVTSGFDVIIGKGGNTANWNLTNGFIYQLDYDPSTSKIVFYYNNGGGAAGVTGISGGTQSINSWYHVAVVTNTSNNITLYINGTSVATATNAISKPTTRTRFRVGTDLSNNNYQGYISNLRIYKGKALTASEVQQNYNALRRRFGI